MAAFDLEALPDDVVEGILSHLPPQELCLSVACVSKRLNAHAVNVFNGQEGLYYNVNLSDHRLVTLSKPLPYKRVIISKRRRSGLTASANDEVLGEVAGGNWARWFRSDITSLSIFPTQECQQETASKLMRDLSKFQQLVRLDLSGLWLKDIIEPLSRMENLKELILRGSSVEEEELKNVKKLANLKLVDLSFLQVFDSNNNEVTERSVALDILPVGIESFILHDFNLEKKLMNGRFGTLSRFENLRELNLRSMCFFAVSDFTFLRNMTKLEKICLDTGGYTGDWNSVVHFAESLASPSKLKHVTLTKTAGDYHRAFTKAIFPDLKSLNLTGSSLHVGEPKEELVEVKELNLSYCSVVNAQSLPLEKAVALNLRHCRYLSSKFMDKLGRCHRLERLLLDGNDSNATNLRKLHRLNQLRVLSVQSPWVGNLGLKTIAFLRNIEFLSAKDCNLSDLGLIYLESLENLRFANLTGNAFTSEASLTLGRMKHMEKFLIDRRTSGKLQRSNKNALSPTVSREFSIAEYGAYPRDELYPPHF